MEPTRPPLVAGNRRIKQLRRLLGRRSARREVGRFVLEGPILVAEALAAGVPIDEVYVDEGIGGAERWPWLAAVSPSVLWPVASGVLARVLDTATPQPVAAVVDLPTQDVAAVLAAGPAPFVVVLAGVADPGNVGTVIRTAAATGAGVLALEGTADPFSPKAVRASAGAVLRVALAETSTDEVLAALGAAGVPIWVADSGAGSVPDDCPLAGPVALVVGSEAHGVPAALDEAAAGRLHLPMAAGTESLNAGVAASVLLFDVLRQRRAAGTDGRPGEGTP